MAIGLDTSALTLSAGTTTIDSLPYVTVSGTYRFQSLTPMLGTFVGNPITIRFDTSVLAG